MDTYDPAALESITSLLSPDEGPDPRAIAAYLRGRENLGELGMAGGPALAPQASATLSGARGRLNDLSQRQGMVLKRALWSQGKAQPDAPDEELLVTAEGLGFPRGSMSQLTKAQVRGIVASEEQRQRAARSRSEAMQAPDALAEKEAKAEGDRLERVKKQIEIEKGRRDLATSPASPRFGEEWEPLPSSPLIESEQKRMAFLEAAGEAKEARRLAAQLKSMVDAGLGPMSSAEDKTRAESLVTRLQLIGKKVDALGVLSETDIKKFIEPQLVNPAAWGAAVKQGFGQFDPKAQIDQYLANLDGKIEASARTWAVKRKGGSAPAGGTSPTVRVQWKGKIKEIPAARLQEALKLGATEVK